MTINRKNTAVKLWWHLLIWDNMPVGDTENTDVQTEYMNKQTVNRPLYLNTNATKLVIL